MDFYGRFILGGHSSDEWSMCITGEGTYNYPRRARELVSVPGRSGALIRDLGYYENVELTYKVTILENFEYNIRAFMYFIQSQKGYIRLEDTYHPDVYRMVLSNGGIEVEALQPDSGASYRGGNFELTFTCKPQAYLKEGEKPFSIAGQAGTYTWHNKYNNSFPLIRIKKAHTTDACNVCIHPISEDPYVARGYQSHRYDAIFECAADSISNVGSYNCESKLIYGGSDETVVYDGNFNASNALKGLHYYLQLHQSPYTTYYGRELPSFDAGDITLEVTGTFNEIQIFPQWWVI